MCVVLLCAVSPGGGASGEIPWCFSQVKGTIEDEVAEGRLELVVCTCVGSVY